MKKKSLLKRAGKRGGEEERVSEGKLQGNARDWRGAEAEEVAPLAKSRLDGSR